MTQPAHGCARCDARWGGSRTCHCSAEGCHQTFTGLQAFEAHRTGSHSTGKRHCLIPASIGLVQADDRPYPCWTTPEGAGEPED